MFLSEQMPLEPSGRMWQGLAGRWGCPGLCTSQRLSRDSGVAHHKGAQARVQPNTHQDTPSSAVGPRTHIPPTPTDHAGRTRPQNTPHQASVIPRAQAWGQALGAIGSFTGKPSGLVTWAAGPAWGGPGQDQEPSGRRGANVNLSTSMLALWRVRQRDSKDVKQLNSPALAPRVQGPRRREAGRAGQVQSLLPPHLQPLWRAGRPELFTLGSDTQRKAVRCLPGRHRECGLLSWQLVSPAPPQHCALPILQSPDGSPGTTGLPLPCDRLTSRKRDKAQALWPHPHACEGPRQGLWVTRAAFKMSTVQGMPQALASEWCHQHLPAPPPMPGPKGG